MDANIPQTNHEGPTAATFVGAQPAIDLDVLLDRKRAAEALTAAGFKESPATLATRACRGGGPAYRIYGRRPLYRLGDLLDWAEGRLGALVTSTSAAAPLYPRRIATPASACDQRLLGQSRE